MKLLEIRGLFEEETDAEHGLTTTQIIARLKVKGISAARKAIYDDIRAINHFYTPVDKRLFSVADLKLMIDAIKSSRFLTEAKTQELVEGLRTLCSKHQAQALRREVIVTNRGKNMNESIHRSVEFLTTAIEKGVQIRFKYFDYNVKQERVYRNKSGFHTISPNNLI